jgi:hypothetical protein
LGHILLYMPMKFDFVLSADLVAWGYNYLVLW